MSNASVSLYRDFEWDGADRHTLTRVTDHGVFRAVVEHDYYPHEPENDAGCPVLSVDHTYRGRGDIEMTGYGSESERHDGLPMSLADAYSRIYHGPYGYESPYSHAQTVEILDRWLRTFHGGSLIEFTSSVDRNSPNYIAYDTEAMRHHWGLTGEALKVSEPKADEWEAYIDGDVYAVGVERAISFDDEGEPDDWEWEDYGPCHGYYGDDYAAQAALEGLEATIRYYESTMLPLEVA